MGQVATILVVDDSVLIRLHLAGLLQQAGFKTLLASTADDAVKILESRDDIGAVLTDIEMPGSMNGLALVHYVRKRWPPTILIISSGRQAPEKDVLPSGAAFLPKPIRSEDLVNFLRDAQSDG